MIDVDDLENVDEMNMKEDWLSLWIFKLVISEYLWKKWILEN